MNETPTEKPKFVDAVGLLEALFDEHSRPSLRWLRGLQASRKISYKKIGARVFFDIDQARAEIDENLTVHSRKYLRGK